MERKARRRSVKRPAGFSSAREDLISQLPDALITQILSYLPTKEAVTTSVLSNRWKSLWLLIPKLDLDANEFESNNAFLGFVDKFLDFSREHNSCLHKIKLIIPEDESDQSRVTRWINFVATPKLKHLDVECLLVKEVMPVSLYICESLLYLRLHRVLFGSFESVSLPHLKTMRLEQNVYANEASLESLISSCPVLEDLSIVRRLDDNVKVLRVYSQTLTSLSVGCYFGANAMAVYDYYTKGETGLLIDSPRLKYLYFKNEISKSKSISNTGSLVKVSFAGYCYITLDPSNGFDLSNLQTARSFFIGISRVRDMIFSKSIMELISDYLQVEPLPQLCNLSCLEAKFYYSDARILSTFLESCPNLKSIILDLTHSTTWMAPISFSSVPQCLLSSLKFVEIKNRFTGRTVEVNVARYFVENSVVLKKLVVHLSDSMQRKSLVHLRDLLALPRPSNCQIVYVTDC